MKSFFFWAVVALAVPLLTLIAQWQRDMHRGHMSYFDWLMGLVFGETFQLSRAF